MTEIGFYHLTRATLEQALPNLLERVLAAGQRAVLRVGGPERLEALDRHLWTYRNDAFLAHGTKADGFAAEQPIWLTAGDDNPNGAKVLLLADGAPPEPMTGFDRVLDLFDGNDPDAVTSARERWKAAKAAGHKLVYWQQDEQGRWKKAAESS